jgi:dihydrolipoamide dehydrogenase
VNQRGFIEVDGQRRTASVDLAIGDVAGDPMLAHKASHEARVAVGPFTVSRRDSSRARSGSRVHRSEPRGPGDEKREGQNIPIRNAGHPWAVSGRATTLDRRMA